MSRLDPHSHADLTQGRVIHIDLVWDLDFETRVIDGLAVLRLDAPVEGVLHLDTRDLDLLEVTDDRGRALTWVLGEDGGFMGRRLDVSCAGAAAVRLRYRTSPRASALLWLEPSQTSSGHPFVLSQCQPIHARSMVPCQDTPRARITYTAQVTVPDPLAAVMSARPGETGEGSRAGTTTTTFHMPQPIPTYLLALAVGRLEARELGPRSTVYAEPEVVEAAAWEFAEVDSMLLAAEDLFGPYPWERFDFIVLPPAFPYGGMENPRLTFLTPTLIAGDRSLVGVLAHELAHSWTGNLVSNATMDHFWLNEGFTVWAERRIQEVLQGEEAVSLGAALGRNALQRALDLFGAGSPYGALVNDLAGIDPDDVYSVVPYEKGFLFVVLLERTLGRPVFDAFLRAYMDRFAFTSITTDELCEFVEARHPGLLERVGADAWLHGTGIPEGAPAFPSARLDALRALGAGFATRRPTRDETATWTTAEWLVWLQAIPAPLAEADCTWLDGTFDLSASGNAEIKCQWLVMAAAAGYAPALPAARDFVSTVGRMKFLKPLYRAVASRDEGRAAAREWLAEFGVRYHPIARQGLEQLLA